MIFVSESGLDSFGSVYGPFADSRKHDNEPSVEKFEFEDNIRVIFVSECGLDSFAQCRAHLRTHVNVIMNLRSKNWNLRIILV